MSITNNLNKTFLGVKIISSELQENLLQAWINMNSCIRGNRIVSTMTYNEILICNILYRSQKVNNYAVTATDLCKYTKMLKSQINKIVSGMVEKGYVERVRSKEDKRKIFIRLLDDCLPEYLSEHNRIMEIMDTVYSQMGTDKVKELTELMNEAIEIVDKIQYS